MKDLTDQQRQHLKWAVRVGTISRQVADDALSSAKRQDTSRLSIPHEPVRPRHSQELNVAQLHIQISGRELEILLEKRKSLAIDRQISIKRSQIAMYESAYEALKLNRQHIVVPPVPQPKLAEVLPVVDPKEQARRQAVIDALDMAATIESIANALESQKTLASHSPIHRFGIMDATLCMTWSDVQLDMSIDFWEATKIVDTFKRCLVYSARTAELAAQNYYHALGCEVEDVSVKQLNGYSTDWVNFDIRADNRFIDVKNARQALHGPGHFVEHCVPRFKKDRTSFQDVAIVGVLSGYISDPSDYVNIPQTVCVLGELTIDDLRSIYRWSRVRFGRSLDLQGLWKPQYVAGWLFEYPSEHYSGRASAIQAIQPLLRRIRDAGGTGDEIPGWMLVLCQDDSLIGEFAMDETRCFMLQELRAIQVAVGLSRRSLYVYALGLTLECLSNKRAPGADLARMLSLLKIGAPWGSGSTLLGLRDSQSYVEHLVETLTEIGQAVIDKGLELTGFKLTHPAILLGITMSGRTLTLLAYCGGWQSIPFKARCGKAPLTLARHNQCSGCGHLICDNCGHCSHICPKCQTRQAMMAAAPLSSDAEAEQSFAWKDPIP